MVKIGISEYEIAFILNAIAETQEYLNVDEFHPRTDLTKQESGLLRNLSSIYQKNKNFPNFRY